MAQNIEGMSMKEMKCPCCGKTAVSEYDVCPVCHWENDPIQLQHPDTHGANRMTLKEAKEAYKKGQPVK